MLFLLRKIRAKLMREKNVTSYVNYAIGEIILVVLGILGVLATVLTIVINPGHQLARARDVQRETDIYAIMSAIYQYSIRHAQYI